MDTKSILKASSVFSALDEGTLGRIAALTSEIRHTAEGTVFNENDSADAFYLVAEGEIVISRKIGRERKILAVLGPGSVFGEMAFFSDSPRTADAKARGDCMLLKIGREAFSSFISGDPGAGNNVLSGLLRVSMQRLEETSRELATIYQTGNIISRSASLTETARSLREQLLIAVPEADDAAIFLYNEFNMEYDPAAARDGTREIVPSDPVATMAARMPSGSLFDDGTDIPIVPGLTDTAKSVIFAPLRGEGKLPGFILLWSGRQAHAFKKSSLLLTMTVGAQLAEAVENMHYRQEARDRERLRINKGNY